MEKGSPPDWLRQKLNHFESQVRNMEVSNEQLLELQNDIEDLADDADITIYWLSGAFGGMNARMFGACYGVYSMPAAERDF